MGKSLENSVFIATFVGDSTKNLYSKKPVGGINLAHT